MSTERIWELMARKLAGEASADELEELEQLLRNHPDLHVPVQAIADLWQHTSPPPDNISVTTSYQHHIARMQAKGISIGQAPDDNVLLLEGTRKPSGRRYWMYTGIAASLIGAAWFLYWLLLPPTVNLSSVTEKSPPNEIVTRNGSKTRVQLPDGTHVWLNAGSKLTYEKDFGATIREVTLTGEGYFDVVRNEKKPFIIHTVKMDVKVLGTQFNVKSYPNEKTTEAALIHGSIEVSLKDRPSEKFILKPNEKIIVANKDSAHKASHAASRDHDNPGLSLVEIRHLTYQKKDSAVVETSWLENRLAFQNESFRELALKMERWYGVSIQFKDEKTAGLRFTGTFEDEPVEDVMRALTISWPFNYKFQGKTIIVSQ
ncbi:FecR domain-containing protein [Paraflavitalea sp. CAU 1676]|uniref:FecR family protein n=1 Tax=Paraflavitalea sp. CAU 1676 TaxID=3032598 RepID=UPI0023D98B8E|nr:FecR domain-containing protein [Paraflavitalea sp. CAU 1676]MDF2186823.1 DUF4974 domain-containing protein [Paraflavitalea sp. CAU 1676]